MRRNSGELIEECAKADAVAFIKIVHVDPNNITDTGLIVLPNKNKPKRTGFPNLKRGHPILNERTVISIEATGTTGICFCWEFYEAPHYGGKSNAS